MTLPSPTPAVGLIRGSQRLTMFFGFYVFALFMVLAFLGGSVVS
jgi:hypothetical protein